MARPLLGREAVGDHAVLVDPHALARGDGAGDLDGGDFMAALSAALKEAEAGDEEPTGDDTPPETTAGDTATAEEAEEPPAD